MAKIGFESNIMEDFEKIQRLYFSFIYNFRDETLFRFNIPGLKEIDLCETRITDKALEYLADNCPLLEQVTIANCASVTDNGVIYMVDKLKHLRHLDITGCWRITRVTFYKVLTLRRLSCHMSETYANIEDVQSVNIPYRLEDGEVIIEDQLRLITI